MRTPKSKIQSDSVDNLYWLDQIQSTDLPLVGEKAFYLSNLLQQGYPVVNGFVVPAPSFREFLETMNWSDPLGLDLSHSALHLDVDNPRQLQRVCQKIRQEIMAAALPASWLSTLESAVEAILSRGSEAQGVAYSPYRHVRGQQQPASSDRQLGHSANDTTDRELFKPITALLQCSPSITLGELGDWYKGRGIQILPQLGFYETHICLRELKALSVSLKQTWAELFRARSLFYWQRAGIGLQQMNLAILVQPIFTCLASGTLQSDTDSFSIQATWGLPDALSKGEVIPDSFRVDSETGAVQSQQLGSKTLAYGLVDGSSFHLSSLANSGLTVHSLWPRANDYEQSTMNDRQYSVLNDCLQAYLLGEEQQKQYALEEKYLKQLIELAQQLKIELNTVFSLEWMLSLTGEGSEPSLWIAQITEVKGREGATERLRTNAPKAQLASDPGTVAAGTHVVSNSSRPPSPSAPLARGLAAASGRTMAKAHVISGFSKNVEAIPSGRILVTKSVTPDWLPLLKRAAGVVAELGGMTCHAAIMARELGIPAVVGAAGVTQLIQTDEYLLVDGDIGAVSRVNSAQTKVLSVEGTEEEEKAKRQHNKENLLFPLASAPNTPIGTQLLVNLSQSESIERAAALPLDGVGLLRSELMVLEALENRHPNWWVQQGRQRELVQTLSEAIYQFACGFWPRPVFYRSLDLRSHEFQSLTGGLIGHPETNPMLGMRGTFSYLSEPTLFDIELAALAQVQQLGYTNVNLLLPFVRTVEEFSFCRNRTIAAGLTTTSQFQLWIMAEVPSVLFLLPDYVKAGVQGVSIGTNDLTQLLLGVDRDQAQMAPAFNERHPAVLQAIRSIIQLTKTAGIPCSICGLAPSRSREIVDQLVLAGITSISVELDAVELTYQAIARSEQRLLLEAARRHFLS